MPVCNEEEEKERVSCHSSERSEGKGRAEVFKREQGNMLSNMISN